MEVDPQVVDAVKVELVKAVLKYKDEKELNVAEVLVATFVLAAEVAVLTSLSPDDFDQISGEVYEEVQAGFNKKGGQHVQQ